MRFLTRLNSTNNLLTKSILSHNHHHHHHHHQSTITARYLLLHRHFSTKHYGNSQRRQQQLHDRNRRIAMYLASAAIGAIGATYASVPLYKLFCQATGFGGTTQRVTFNDDSSDNQSPFSAHLSRNIDSSSLTNILTRRIVRQLDSFYDFVQSLTLKTASPTTTRRMAKTHGNTWTDEELHAKLSTLKPLPNSKLLRVYFDANTSSTLPWDFHPTQSSIRVVPGETALSFFTAKNNSDKPIVGVATYNVHPPKAGLYFNKVQCFCFEEQRLLPGEEVDMPVFFYIDPEIVEDPYMDRVQSITLSYTFFKSDDEDWDDGYDDYYDDEDDDDDDDDDDEEEDEEEEEQQGKEVS